MAVKKKESKTEVKSENKAQAGRSSQKLAIIVIRGNVNNPRDVIDTLEMLNLYRKNHCTVVENTPSYLGMINKIKDFVAWGEINDATYKELVAKRGEEFNERTSDSKNKYNYKYLEFNGKKYKKYFRLSPPRKGFGKKGIKAGFNAGGVLGYWGEKINDLIARML